MKTLSKMIILFLGFMILMPVSSMADGFIVTGPGRYSKGGFSLAVTDHRVKVEINELAAETTIEQDFYNPARYRTEGVYLFPVPAGASIDSFTIYQNGREMKSELLDSKKAARIYENIVRRMKDPALLEYRNRNLIRVKIYPFGPNETKSIKIRYREILRKDNNRVFYSYPLNTEKFSSRPLKKVSVDISIKSSHRIGDITCPHYSHETVSVSDYEKRVSYEDEEVLPDRDFDISFSHIQRGMNFSLLTYKKRFERQGYFLLDITPVIPVQKNISQDIIFVLDTSGSMRGKKILQAKESLRFCIRNLKKKSRFQIIGFSSNVKKLFDSPVPPTGYNLKKAMRFIKNMEPAGGTNIYAALSNALREKERRHRVIVFITDGKPTIGEVRSDKILRAVTGRSERTRIFTFGIGYDINTLLLDRITEKTKAFRTYIKPDEDIHKSISSFFEKVNSPVMTDPEIMISGPVIISKTCPGHIPDLFSGSTLVLTGRYSGNGDARVQLKGYAGSRKITHTVRLNFPSDQRKFDFLPRLWASRRIAELLDSIRIYGNEQEKINEITRLASRYGIVTPYTSYLILEKERKRPPVYRPFTSPFKKSSGSKFKSYRKKFESIMNDEGEKSVTASREIQDMKQSKSFRSNTDALSRIIKKIKTVNDIHFYYNGDEWIDSRLLKNKNKKFKKIQFLSKEYFSFIYNNPEIAEMLSIGKKMRFMFKGKLYQIRYEKR